MKEKIILFSFLVLTLLLSGCVEELGNCMQKCNAVCEAAKEKGVDLNGYNLQLKKTTGSTTLTCSCSCESAPQKYLCPDKSKLEYDAATGTYKEWVNCMPPVNGRPFCLGNSAKEYEQWVNQNCGIKFELGFAV